MSSLFPTTLPPLPPPPVPRAATTAPFLSRGDSLGSSATSATLPNGGSSNNNDNGQSSAAAGGGNTKRKFAFLHKYRVELPEAIRSVAGDGRGLTPLENTDSNTPYQPTPYDIVCGRGRGNYNCQGNLLFREVVAQHVDRYLSATTKAQKTAVLCEVLSQVKTQSNGKCRFIKQRPDDGVWCELGEVAAREKAGHAMRELCATRKKLNTSKRGKTNVTNSMNGSLASSVASNSLSNSTASNSANSEAAAAAALVGMVRASSDGYSSGGGGAPSSSKRILQNQSSSFGSSQVGGAGPRSSSRSIFGSSARSSSNSNNSGGEDLMMVDEPAEHFTPESAMSPQQQNEQGQVFGRGLVGLPASNKDVNDDSVLSAIGSSSFLAQRSSDFFARYAS